MHREDFDPSWAGRVSKTEDVFQAAADAGNNNTSRATHSPQTRSQQAELNQSLSSLSHADEPPRKTPPAETLVAEKTNPSVFFCRRSQVDHLGVKIVRFQCSSQKNPKGSIISCSGPQTLPGVQMRAGK